MSELPDYYKVLQVDESADPEVIGFAYKARMLKAHPDRIGNTPQNEDQARLINEAKEVLIDPVRRAEYDRSRKASRASRESIPRPQSRPSHPPQSPSEAASTSGPDAHSPHRPRTEPQSQETSFSGTFPEIEPEEEGGLRRGLKSRHLQLIALGGIIGSAYFLGTGQVISQAGPGAIFAYLLGGMLVYVVMLCLGELAVHIPIAGSFVTYANQFINPTWGCGVGWSYWLTWVTFVPAEMIAAGKIMTNFVPAVSPVWWALAFGLLVTAINLAEVGAFGEMEFWLALLKIIAIVMFCIMAVLIFFGVIGNQGYVGTKLLLDNGGLLPFGLKSVLLTMVLILVNFQGSEIIGLAAGESKDPAHSIPSAVKSVSYRIIALYVIPVMLLVTIFPWNEASLEGSVFAVALQKYGFSWAGHLFSFVVLTAAISCSNSGLYATSRALYSLSREGMAPPWLGLVNKKGVPHNAILLSVGGCWIGVLAFALSASDRLYVTLLGLSGFTGAVAWISICWSQFRFRRRLQRQRYDVSRLLFRVPWFPWLTLFGIWAQVMCLAVIVLDPEQRITFYLSMTMLALPMLWYRFAGHGLQTTRYEDEIKNLP